MRVVSWNMKNNSAGTWEHLREELDPDIALLQESPHVSEDLEPYVSTIDVNGYVRNSIYVKDGVFKEMELPAGKFEKTNPQFDWDTGIKSVEISHPKFKNIAFISVYGNLKYFGGGLDIVLSGVLNLHIQTLKTVQEKEHIIIAGDFNMDRRMDDNPTGTKFSRPGEKRHNIFFDTILKNGFKDCVQKYRPNYTRTYRHQYKDDSYPWQLDHIFATPALFDSLKKLEVFNTPTVKELSDHNPIVADFDI